MDELNRVICEMLKRQLKKSGIAYKEVATQLEVSEVSIKRLLNGHQSLSLSRVREISQLLQIPLSSIIAEAEESMAVVSIFTKEQDHSFYEMPELYTIFHEIVNKNADSKQLMELFGLNEPSMYLYIRELEKLGLISILFGLAFKLSVPKNITFSDSAKFPILFKNEVIENLQKQVQKIDSNNKNTYLIISQLRLTEDEFRQYNLKLEEVMLDALKLSQTRGASSINTNEYTIVDMGARGIHHPELKMPVNII
ncbi:helix-turn-helix domain-containing protein [Photobacterium indicum]|uniref:helix-turn-helix domain-containing protein n=1 Tax=Photobacterium indicum TaxID=81447 RepID=UPI003D0996AD